MYHNGRKRISVYILTAMYEWHFLRCIGVCIVIENLKNSTNAPLALIRHYISAR